MKGESTITDEVIKFGPSGNSKSFYEQGYKSSVYMPKWLHQMGLNAYEYSLTRGVNIKEKTARAIGEEAKKWGIAMSVHAPYYINMAAQDVDKQIKSKRYLLESIRAAHWLGAKRVVFHPGSCAKIDRQTALKTAGKLILEVIEEAAPFIEKGIHLCPETMGKKNQLGTLDEIIYLCSLHDSLIPTLDFGHIHAMGTGALNTREDYRAILDAVENALGEERTRYFHCHFSRIEYTEKGEKRHLTLDDIEYGPEFSPLAEILIEKNLKPTIICESRENMAEDALKLKKIFEEKQKEGV